MKRFVTGRQFFRCVRQIIRLSINSLVKSFTCLGWKMTCLPLNAVYWQTQCYVSSHTKKVTEMSVLHFLQFDSLKSLQAPDRSNRRAKSIERRLLSVLSVTKMYDESENGVTQQRDKCFDTNNRLKTNFKFVWCVDSKQTTPNETKYHKTQTDDEIKNQLTRTETRTLINETAILPLWIDKCALNSAGNRKQGNPRPRQKENGTDPIFIQIWVVEAKKECYRNVCSSLLLRRSIRLKSPPAPDRSNRERNQSNDDRSLR